MERAVAAVKFGVKLLKDDSDEDDSDDDAE